MVWKRLATATRNASCMRASRVAAYRYRECLIFTPVYSLRILKIDEDQHERDGSVLCPYVIIWFYSIMCSIHYLYYTQYPLTHGHSQFLYLGFLNHGFWWFSVDFRPYCFLLFSRFFYRRRVPLNLSRNNRVSNRPKNHQKTVIFHECTMDCRKI